MTTIRPCPLCNTIPAIVEGERLWFVRCSCEFAMRCRPMPTEHAARHEWQFRVGRALQRPRLYLPGAKTLGEISRGKKACGPTSGARGIAKKREEVA